MGAWGHGPFDNDDAGDWAFSFDDAAPEDKLAVLDAAFGEAVATDAQDYLDMDQGTVVVAAATVLAALVDHTMGVDDNYGPSTLATLRDAGLEIPAQLREKALVALDRVTGENSEWRDLWEDAGSLDEASAPLTHIRTVLRSM